MLPPDKVHEEKIKVNEMECLGAVRADDEDWMRQVFPQKQENVVLKSGCFKLLLFSHFYESNHLIYIPDSLLAN